MPTDPVVFVLEDDPGIATLVRRVCANAGLPARFFSAAADFLKEEDIDAGSLILLDLGLNDTTGVDVLRSLAARRCPAPVYLMSGRDDRLLKSVQKLGQSYGLDVRGILQKPFRLRDLQEVLDAPRGRVARSGRVTPVEDLHRAVIGRELCLHYQPKVGIGTRSLAGCEALIRWQHPVRGLLMPGDFLPIAEEAGLMGMITEWVMDEALRQVAEWRQAGLHLKIAVNVPADMLNELPFPTLIESLLASHSTDGSCLILEVTEAAAMKSLLTTVDVLVRLRLMGVSLSIDDFGTGHSSMVKLRQLPFDEMKIDRSFVKDLSTEPDAEVLIGAMIALARSFGMKSVAEGVERAEDLERLAQLGCEIAQGYYFSRPLPPPDFAAWANALQGEGGMPTSPQA